jgi:hypothetical protein
MLTSGFLERVDMPTKVIEQHVPKSDLLELELKSKEKIRDIVNHLVEKT